MPSLSYLRRTALAVAVLFVASTATLQAMPLSELGKMPKEERAQFISAAVSMTAYIAAADGDVTWGRCVAAWYFGPERNGIGDGVDAIASEILVAERVDPKKFHIEGIILGLAEKACGSRSSAQSK